MVNWNIEIFDLMKYNNYRLDDGIFQHINKNIYILTVKNEDVVFLKSNLRFF